MRFLAANIDAFEGDRSLLWRNNSHNAPEGRGLTRSVATQEGNQFSLLYFRRDPFEDVSFPIIGMDVLKSKHSNPPQIGLLHFLIIRDLRGRPFGQDTSLIHDCNDV